MIRILGIDPGSRVTGYGVIDVEGQTLNYVDSGCIRTSEETLVERLKGIFNGVDQVIDRYRPTEFAIEKVFMNRNADSALKLGQARGAALVAAVRLDLPVSEFTPAQIKQAIVGKGNATKEQVQHMVKMLLCLAAIPPADAADALATAVCCCHTQQSLARMPGVQGSRNGRLI